MKQPISGISSKATGAALQAAAAVWQQQTGTVLQLELTGGVDAARRVEQGERFDLVFLAAGPIDRLIGDGHLRAPRVDLMRSPMVAAVARGAPRPAIGSEAALREAVLAARRIGYSTGPSGDHVLQLLERWQLAGGAVVEAVQAPSGVPVGQLVASGRVTLGFQQRSELIHHDGVDVLGDLPEPVGLVTVFSAGVGRDSAQVEATGAFCRFVRSPAAAAVLRRHGLEPAV